MGVRLIKKILCMGVLLLMVPVARVSAASPAGTSVAPDAWLNTAAGVHSDSSCTGGITDGQAVGCWEDQSSGGTYDALQTTSGEEPVYSTSSTVNGNNTINWEGAPDELTISSNFLPTASSTDPYTVYVVFAPDVVNGFPLQTPGGSTLLLRNETNGFTYQTEGQSGTYTDSTLYSGSDSAPRQVSFVKNSGATNDTYIYYNALQVGNKTASTQHADGVVLVGRSGFDGQILEILAYQSALSATDQSKVDTYLALKYGYSLLQTGGGADYVDSAGMVVWESADSITSAGTGGYVHNIAGLARDDTGSLSVTSTQNQETGAILSASVGSLDDLEYLIWGHNNGPESFSIYGAPDGYSILGRTWKVQEKNTDTGTVMLSFDVDDTVFDVVGITRGASYYLVVDTDADGVFTDETPVEMSSSGSIWSTTTNLEDGELFTLAITAGTSTGETDSIGATELITFSGSFTEATANDGSVTGSIVATIDTGSTAETFDVADGEALTAGSDYIVANLPAGLSATVTVSASGSVATLSLSGSATSHANANDVADLRWALLDGAFTSGNHNLVRNDTVFTGGAIDFTDPAAATTTITSSGSAGSNFPQTSSGLDGGSVGLDGGSVGLDIEGIVEVLSGVLGTADSTTAFGQGAGAECQAVTMFTLRRGDKNSAVGRLQTALFGLGYYVGNIDNIFGVLTTAAVEQFQLNEGLVVDGIVGPVTTTRLEEILCGQSISSTDFTTLLDVDIEQGLCPFISEEVLSRGVAGVVVLQLQKIFSDYYTGALDGVYGMQTKAAVEDFQKEFGLAVDGIVGPITRKAINQYACNI